MANGSGGAVSSAVATIAPAGFLENSVASDLVSLI